MKVLVVALLLCSMLPARPVMADAIGATPVGESFEDGFFVLRQYRQRLIAGAFGYAGKQKIFSYPPWRPAHPGIVVGESVCALAEFDGWLYANTEASGKIFRSADGERWELVFDGAPHVGCGLAVFNGLLYATITNFDRAPGEIHRSPDGTRWQRVYSSGRKTRYIREIVAYRERLYAFFVDSRSQATGVLVSADGLNWQRLETPARMIRGHVHGGYLWLAATSKYSKHDESSIWRFDGRRFKRVHRETDKSHISNISSMGGALLATTVVEWKGRGGGASLLRSCDGGRSWRTAATFDETEAYGLQTFEGALYVGTKQEGGGGKVYRIDAPICPAD
jgi:hypothetical protein